MFLQALGLTVAIETTVLWGVTRLFRRGGTPPSTGRVLACGILCSSATLPYLWFVLPAWVQDRHALMAIGEPAVTLVEAGILALALPAGPARALALSFACNLVSFLMGLAVMP
ncbi:MAG: hypothetical protein JF616_12975 [Fibrobacteres bacterium]|nr:hypothetical protein [Fibrobacterota bacterium]